MSEEPTWEVCRKLVGCPIISLLIFGRCLLKMERVRVSKGICLAGDQLTGNGQRPVEWPNLTFHMLVMSLPGNHDWHLLG